MAVIGVEQYGQRVRELGGELRKNPGSVSRWVTNAAERRMSDSGFAKRLRNLDHALHRLPEYREEEVRVKQGSTIRVKNNTYSAPSRLKGEKVRVRVYDDRLEVYYGGTHQMTTERLLGEGGHSVNYRHIIWSLVTR